jgi:hypothetical protein
LASLRGARRLQAQRSDLLGATVTDNFIAEYLRAFKSIEGWFSFDAALMFMAYNQLIADAGIAGDVLEIGVHHGLSAIGVASLRGPAGSFVAVDLFENLQAQNVSGSGSGNRQIFRRNMETFYEDLGFLKPIARASTEIKPRDLGKQFSFCNIDGGHSQHETYHDLDLCCRILLTGGLVALDDYFNPMYPGVCEGAARFMLRYPKVLRPIAVGFNKVLLQKQPCKFDLNVRFSEKFPRIPRVVTTMWQVPTLLLDRGPFRAFIDLGGSCPNHLIPSSEHVFGVDFKLDDDHLTARRGQEVTVRVTTVNRSATVLETVYSDIGLTHHLRDSEMAPLAWDNARVAFHQPLRVGQQITLDLPVSAPEQPGIYFIEVDLVWEGVMWFQETGNKTVLAQLTVV